MSFDEFAFRFSLLGQLKNLIV